MVEASPLLQAGDTDGLQDSEGAYAIGIGSVLRCLEGNRNVAHGREVANLIGLHLLNDAYQIGGVCKITIMQFEICIVDVRPLIEVTNTVGIDHGGAVLDAIASLQQKICEVSAILTSDAGN